MNVRTGGSAPAVIHGAPLSEMAGLGALTLPGIVQEIAARFDGAEALVMPAADGASERWTYADLLTHSVAIARSLIASGVTSHSRVGILMAQRPEWLAAFFGIGLVGATAVALSTFSTPPELQHLIQLSGVSTLLFEPKVAKRDFVAILKDLEPQLGTAPAGKVASLVFPALRRLVVTDGPGEGAIESWSDFLAKGSSVSPALVGAAAAAVTPADPGVLFFSSGSAGRPKGILSSHRAIAVQFWRWGRLQALADDVRALSGNGFFWSGNFCQTIAATLSVGGSIVLQPVFDAGAMLDLIQRERISYPVAWPHQWAQLVEAPNWASVDLSSLRYVESESPLARHPTVSTNYRSCYASYGNTETFTVVAAYPAQTPPELAEGNHGAALEGCTIKIVDPLTGATLQRGEHGEIAVKGPTLMAGYVGIPLDQTLDGEGFFRCGDGGYINDHDQLVFAGRLSDIIKTGGANVSPVEVNAVLETCPGVMAGVTVGIPHDTLGEMVVACVTPFDDAAIDEDTVRSFLKERLASYKVPRRVLFVQKDDLSLTGSAKFRTSALRELAARQLSA